MVELLGARLWEACKVPRGLDHRHLHAKTDAEVGDLAGPGELGRPDLAFGAPLAEAAGHKDRVKTLEMGCGVLGLENLGVNPLGGDAHAVRHAAMGQRLGDGFVGVLELGVLADDGDADGRRRGVLDGGRLDLESICRGWGLRRGR